MTVAFIDTQTTGLDPDRHEIWEVGLILPDGRELEWRLPVDLSRADPIALNIGRYHERAAMDVPSNQGTIERTLLGERTDGEVFIIPRLFMPKWATIFVDLTRGLHLAGAVVSFDTDRLWRLLRANGECPMWHYHIIDVEALAAASIITAFATCQEVGNPEADGPTQEQAMLAFPPWKSSDLSRAVGVDPDDFNHHTALGDARWAAAIYRAVMGLAPTAAERATGQAVPA